MRKKVLKMYKKVKCAQLHVSPTEMFKWFTWNFSLGSTKKLKTFTFQGYLNKTDYALLDLNRSKIP